MVVADMIAALMMLSASVVISLDSPPARRVLYAIARYRRRRRRLHARQS